MFCLYIVGRDALISIIAAADAVWCFGQIVLRFLHEMDFLRFRMRFRYKKKRSIDSAIIVAVLQVY